MKHYALMDKQISVHNAFALVTLKNEVITIEKKKEKQKSKNSPDKHIIKYSFTKEYFTFRLQFSPPLQNSN
jgi:hypothetical protein